MIENLPNFFVSSILGIMLFFSFVVAPVTFTVLDEINSRKFIRKIFPYYYLSNLFLCICAIVTLIVLNNFKQDFYLLLTIAILFFISNFILMPLINKFKDNKEDKKFKYSHLISVTINFIQIVFLFLIIF